MTRLSLHYQKQRQMRNQNLIEAAFRKAIVATIYLQDKLEFMLSAKVNKKFYDVIWTKIASSIASPRIHERAQIDDESCPRQGQYTQSLPEIQIRNHAE